jgi:hypothetical protein
VVIKASSSKQIERLIRELESGDPVVRDAAVARLTVIGTRAVERLVVVARDATRPAPARAAALKALLGIGDPHAADSAASGIEDDNPEVSAAAVLLARRLFDSARGVELIDRLSTIALDSGQKAAMRARAYDALRTLPATTLAPLTAALASDPDPAIAGLTRQAGAPPADAPPRGEGPNLVDAEPGDDAAAFRRAIADAAAQLPLATLHRLLERVRDREQSAAGLMQAEWAAARAALHHALAARRSRLGVYDLRESLEAATAPLPLDMISALTEVGDVSCLEPLVAAYDRINDDWWRRHATDAFHAIVTRERLTKRNGLITRLMKRSPSAMQHLWFRT